MASYVADVGCLGAYHTGVSTCWQDVLSTSAGTSQLHCMLLPTHLQGQSYRDIRRWDGLCQLGMLQPLSSLLLAGYRALVAASTLSWHQSFVWLSSSFKLGNLASSIRDLSGIDNVPAESSEAWPKYRGPSLHTMYNGTECRQTLSAYLSDVI